MIHSVFNLLKDKLNTYFKTIGIGQDGDKVGFVTADNEDTIKFPLGQITPVLINIEEERVMRPPDLYGGSSGQGMVQSENFPEIRINLLTLFVSKFGDYPQALNFLSHIIKFFQINRVFDHHNSPTLSPEIEKLIMELSPPILEEQDAVWNALRTSYLPSVLYKIKMLVYIDQESFEIASQIASADMNITRSLTQAPAPSSEIEIDISQTNAPPLPHTDLPVSDDSPVVNYDTTATVEITSSEEGITYQLVTPDGETSGQAITSKSNEEAITLISNNLIADTTFRIKATALNSGGETYLDTPIPVAVKPRKDPTLVGPEGPIDQGKKASIQLQNAQLDISYQLQIESTNNGRSVVCTTEGETLELVSDALSDTTIFSVEATSTINSETVIIDSTITVEVNDPGIVIDDSLVVNGPHITDYNTSATIRVELSQEGINYQLRDDQDMHHGALIPGNGGIIDLPSDNLIADTIFTVEASPVGSGTPVVDLVQTATVMTGRLRLEGVGDHIDFGDPSMLDITGNQTIEMWIKPDSLSSDQDQFLYYKDYSKTGSTKIKTDGTIEYNYALSIGGDIRVATSDLQSEAGNWIHLAVTRDMSDGTFTQWYVNGETDTDDTDDADTITLTSDVAAAVGGNPNNSCYIGLVAEVRIWNVARSAEDILNNMGKRLEGAQEGLVGYWKLDEGDGTTANDTSGNELHGTIHGDPTWLS